MTPKLTSPGWSEPAAMSSEDTVEATEIGLSSNSRCDEPGCTVHGPVGIALRVDGLTVYTSMPVDRARALAAEILKCADEAEGKAPEVFDPKTGTVGWGLGPDVYRHGLVVPVGDPRRKH